MTLAAIQLTVLSLQSFRIFDKINLLPILSFHSHSHRSQEEEEEEDKITKYICIFDYVPGAVATIFGLVIN